MDAILGISASLLGVIIGALLSWTIMKRQRRIEATFEMHREFNSIEMTNTRYRASEFLEDHPGDTYIELRVRLGRVAMRDVWTVTQFYQRLWLAIRFRSVERKLVPALFGDIFDWWYDNSYQTQLAPLTTEPAHQIRLLKEWMDASSDPQERERWRSGNVHWPIRTLGHEAEASAKATDPL